MPDTNETGSKKTVGLYVDIDPELKYQLERIAFERSGPGTRVALRTIVGEALREYVQRRADQQGQNTPDSDNVLLQPPPDISQPDSPTPVQHGPELDEGVSQEGQLDKRYPEYGGQRSQGEHEQG